jgi:hypothetical protein
MNEMNIEPTWYYTTTWDTLGLGKINIKYKMK